MKKVSSILSLSIIVAILISSCGGSTQDTKTSNSNNETPNATANENVNTTTNDTSNVIGDEVKIGEQIWTTKNLDVDKFRNGDRIPEAKTEEQWTKAWQNKKPAWCYYDNDPSNGIKYGKLYNWYAVKDPRNLAPAGYHIPSIEEWDILSNFLGGERVAGKKMKSTSGWNDNQKASNESRFTGLPGGVCASNGRFFNMGEWGKWWSSTEGRLSGEGKSLFYDGVDLLAGPGREDKGLSVRCIKD